MYLTGVSYDCGQPVSWHKLGREDSQPTVIVVETTVDNLELLQCDRQWAIEFVLMGGIFTGKANNCWT